MHYFCSDAFSALEAYVYLHRTKQAFHKSAPLWFNFLNQQTVFSQQKRLNKNGNKSHLLSLFSGKWAHPLLGSQMYREPWLYIC